MKLYVFKKIIQINISKFKLKYLVSVLLKQLLINFPTPTKLIKQMKMQNLYSLIK